MEDINQAFEQIDSLVQKNASLVHELETQTKALQSQSGDLRYVVHSFLTADQGLGV